MDTEVYELAKNKQFEKVKAKVALGANINMVIMGAADGQQDEKSAKKDHHDDSKSDGKYGEILHWSLINGACLVFSFTQSSTPSPTLVSKYSKNLSMLRGPGEVPRGTFLNK